jgi:hypothetical protein
MQAAPGKYGIVSVALLAGMIAALTTAAQTGGIVPTEFTSVRVEPGPEPDVVFFATGDTMGKIEPCG